MAEQLADKTVFSLAEVARSIQKTIASRYKSTYWVKAEMNKLNHYTHSGHCYPELVEKKDGKVVAEMRSILWKSDYIRINQRFLDIAKEPLRNGITILFEASISYDPLYGMSLRILDIDPAYVLGELEREKMASISRLKQEGLFDANKRLPFPLLPKRIAIISVETSKGFSDFLNIIDRNPWGYRFEHTLFAALLQGDRSVGSIINQLKRISGRLNEFDVVAIIRGGGGEVGLSSYNNYELAAAVARFPIPVLTGIGHSTNETVSEMVAFANAITPSELADFLIQRFHQVAVPVQQAWDTIRIKAQQLLEAERKRLQDTSHYFNVSSRNLLQGNRHAVAHTALALHTAAKGRLIHESYAVRHHVQALESAWAVLIKDRRQTLAALDTAVRIMDPQRVLNRGYSITLHQGKAVRDTSKLQPGAEVETRLADGTFTSIINELKPK